VTLPIDVPRAVALKGVPDVELVAVGSWKASTGPVTITDDDVNQAVAALECPGIHNPVLKLGHDEPDPDAQHIRWDGEPAVGWISNMRLSANGAKVLGDYTGVPAWLVDVMPSAYPQRSVEIERDKMCQIGHVHPFVITAVSLLGVYPPAVGVLKSLNDVQTLYTLAADAGPRSPAARRIAMAFALPGDDRENRRDLTDTEQQSTADFDRDRREWEAGVAALLAAWPSITRVQRDELAAQITKHVDSGQLTALATMDVDSATAADTLYDEMLISAREALDEQIAEARRQGVAADINADVDEKWVRRVAASIAATMALSYAATAGRSAAQLVAPGAAGQSVAADVTAKLSDLSTRFLADQFGGAIGAARMAGRYAALTAAPTGEYYAAEVNDTNTCSNCRSIDGARFDNLDEAMSAYGAGGYQQCSGGGRCRGRLVTVWDVDGMTAIDANINPSFLTAVPTTVSLLSGGQPMPLPATIKARVSAEDVSRAYYKTAGYSNWITAMNVDPLELVTCDDTSGDYYRVPVTVSGDELSFGNPVQVQVEYVDVKTPSGGGKVKARSAVYADDSGEAKLSAFVWSDRAAALDLVGGEPAPEPAPDEPAIAEDVTPAGAAIRKMAAATQAPPADTSADGSASTVKEASGMPFDAAKLREALGLSETASADDALTAFAGALSTLGGAHAPTAPETPPQVNTLSADNSPVNVPQLADGSRPILLDPTQLTALQESARKGETAWAQLRRNERDGVIDGAIRLGKFPAARREYWVQLWDRDPDGTRQAVDALAANVIPVLSQGYLGDDAAQRSAADLAFEGLYGKEG
jgi:hypothetical protein